VNDRESTVRSRELGEELRRAMTLMGYNGADMGRALGWSEAKVSRLLTGVRGGSRDDVIAFLAVCRVIGDEREELLDLGKDRDNMTYLKGFTSEVTNFSRLFVEHEQTAQEVVDYHPTLVPGLLQTADYTRAIMEASLRVPADLVDARVQQRMDRKMVFLQLQPPRFTFLVHEFALRTPIGGRAVMAEQLHFMVQEMARPCITIRVVPASAGVVAAVRGPFRLMTFAGLRPVAFVESDVAGMFVEEPEHTTALHEIIGQLAENALDEGQSRHFLATMARRMTLTEGQQHDPGQGRQRRTDQ
jgi:hypothetical protein